jgi:ABC-type transport system substrate-binding protein
MANVYEPLVRNRLGRIEPEAALSWSVSHDRTKYTFKIDVERRFSNGDRLTAGHFKKAWEEGLKRAPKSSNSSLSDVLYRTKGFESFQKKGVLDGVRAPANDVLEIEFAAPYRSALEDLAGNRYAAVVVQGDETLGTGAYVVEHEAEDAARFRPNPHSRHTGLFKEVTVVVAKAQDAMDLVTGGEIDAFYTFGHHWFEACEKIPNARCLSGPESAHQSVYINGLPGRFFAHPERRNALQALVWSLFSTKEGGPQTFGFSPGLRFDPQFYLPFQAGRLEESEVATRVKSHEADIEELKRATQTQPLKFITGRDSTALIDALRSAGLRLTTDSGKMPFKESLEDYYKSLTSDLIIGGFSVWNGDPDGAYHILSASGAITSPMIQRPTVSALLEEGRALVNLEELDPHYQKVSRAILEEVPFVHVGMVSDQILYRRDRLETDEDLLSRSGNVFHLFRGK